LQSYFGLKFLPEFFFVNIPSFSIFDLFFNQISLSFKITKRFPLSQSLIQENSKSFKLVDRDNEARAGSAAPSF
jgi:hypothetical protein